MKLIADEDDWSAYSTMLISYAMVVALWLTMYESHSTNIFLPKTIRQMGKKECRNGILLPKLFWPTVRKKCSSDKEKLLKFEVGGREFANFLRSLEKFILMPNIYINI